MAEAVMLFAVEKLTELTIQKLTFLGDVEEQVNRLKSELKRMQCFLKDASEKQANDSRIHNWISEIRELAQDTEDVIETFILTQSDNLLIRYISLPKHVYRLDRVGKEIESIRARLKAIEESRNTFGIRNLGDAKTGSSMVMNSVEMRRKLSPWQKDHHVIGLDEDVDFLLRKGVLLEGFGLFVATIVGMGGLGKSTLAKVVYNHSAVANAFHCRAWVCVSNEFDPKETIKELVLQVVKHGEKSQVLEIMEKAPLEHIKSMLYERLKGKRYFIVLDDVWHEQAWESLAGAFPDERDKGSRLLVTSRNQGVPRCARYVHKLKALTWDKSWQLFLTKSFVDGKSLQDFEETGKEILRKCHGLPLAITVIGGVLLRESSLNGWDKVLKGMNSRIDSNNISSILELSYHDLPSQLKSCFLCLAFFKEDSTIQASKLVHVWIAEGLIRQDEEQTMEDIARGYLDELINRNMLQVTDTTKRGRVKTCQIHDLLRDLSITKAKEEIAFEIIRGDKNSSSMGKKSRHRAIYCSTEKNVYSLSTSNSRIRSLFYHGYGNVYHSPSNWTSFELLRVLDMELCKVIVLPKSIGKLIGLRYLGLKKTSIMDLPSSLGCLRNLQVLDIRKNDIKGPNFVWKLDSLRHVYMDYGKIPLKIGNLKNLQTLGVILVNNETIKNLTRMTNLRKLSLCTEENTDVSKLCTSLATLKNLHSLRLEFEVCNKESFMSFESFHSLHSLTLVRCTKKLSKITSFPPNLTYLSLYANSLEKENPIPILEKLPNLLYLRLHSSYDGQEMKISDGGFSRLEVLSLMKLKKLRHIELGKGALPKLERLEIHRCENMWDRVSLSPRRPPKELVVKIVTSDMDLYSQLPDIREYNEHFRFKLRTFPFHFWR